MLLDKQPFMGGNSTKATSGINGAGTNSQAELGIKDSAKTFFDDTKNSAKELARDDLIKVLTGKSADAVHWLQETFGLDLSKVSRLGGHSQPRTHRGGAQFPGMVRSGNPFACPHQSDSALTCGFPFFELHADHHVRPDGGARGPGDLDPGPGHDQEEGSRHAPAQGG